MKKRGIIFLMFLIVLSKAVLAIEFNLIRVTPTGGYDNGDGVEYQLKLVNNTNVTTQGDLSFPIADLTSTLDGGGSGLVFSNIQNSVTSTGLGTNTGGFGLTGNLNVQNFILPPLGTLTYTVKAQINPDVNENITVEAKVLNTLGEVEITQQNSMARVDYDLDVNKKSRLNYYEKGGKVIYDIEIKNIGTSNVKKLDIVDVLDTSAFQSSVISATTTGLGTSAGTFNSSGDLNATNAYIAVGGSITYTIEGQLKNTFTGNLKNSVTLSARKKYITVDAEPEVGINLAQYEYNIEKIALNSGGVYTPGDLVVYQLTVKNTSNDIPITNMSLVDALSSVVALNPRGTLVPAFDTDRIIVVGTSGTNSYAGDYNANSEPNITNISIAPGEQVNYLIRTYVNENIVGEIKNSMTVTDRNGTSKTTFDVGLTSEPANIILEKIALNTESYNPGSSINYQISVKNIGNGIGYGLNVEDAITKISSELANNGGANAQNITANPVISWRIEALLGENSTKSTSNVLQNGGQINNIDLNDSNVIIYPGEEILYNVTLNTSNVAIGNIINTATVDGKISSATYTPKETITTGNPSISITKSTSQNEYEPGGTIIYNIVATNSDTLFANNISIVDELSKILALNTSGSSSEVIKDWTLNFISKTGNGTAQGEFNYGTPNPGTQDLNIIADIGPGGDIQYQLIITVNPDIVGKIFDKDTGGNVVETGNGISMAPYKLELQKEVNETEYTPGKEVVYQITITNSGDGTAVNIPVKDLFSNIKTQLVTGELGDAYTGTQVTATIYNGNGSISTSGPDNPGFSGTLTNKDLNVSAIISPGKSIVYTINATINPLAEGRIINTVQVDGELVSDRGVVTKITDVSISKSVNKGSYPNNIDSNGNYIGDESIIYTITISNGSESGIAMNVPVQDSISTITAELLGGGTAKVFKPGWTIDTEVYGIGTQVSGDPVVNGQDLNTRVNVAPGGRVIFTITGVVDNSDNQIFYGGFTNTANENGVIATATTSPKMPFLKIAKSSSNTSYFDGGEIDYTIVVTNVGAGFANNAEISDSLSNVVDAIGNKAFKSWEITGIAKGYGTTIGSIANNSDINTTVDIAPGGSVTYNIKTQLNTGLKGIITNTAQVYDAQNQNTSTASATEDNAEEDGTIFIRKTSTEPVINPLGQFTYLVDVLNNSKNPIKDIRIYDNLNNIVGNLANLDGKSITDITGQAFLSWDIYKSGVKINSGNNDVLDDTINTLNPQQGVEYTIVATPNPKLLSQKIKNTSYVYNGDTVIGSSFIEDNVLGSIGGITRTANLSRYIPGETLTYTIKVAPNSVGYLNNFSINEDINNLNVGLMNGTTGNIFYDPSTGKNIFTVEFIESESKISSGTVPIPLENIKNNTNLTGIVDVAQGDYLTYKITGKIRPDILGDINYKGIVTKGYRQNLTITKQVTSGSYSPGQELIYILKVENSSKGNAGQVSLIDNIQGITVKNSKGQIVPAFVPNTIKVLNVKTVGYGAFAPDIQNPANINTKIDVPVGGYIQYEISAQVIENAVGRIINTLNVDGDTVSAGADMPQDRFTVSKTMDRYLDVDGVTGVAEGYVPGGYILYTINIQNKNQGILDNYPIKDLIGDINTNLATGGAGKAFTSWTITAETDGSPITDSGSFENNKNIDTTVDIGPNGYIKYTILAKVNPLAVGNFTNSVSVNGVVRTTSIAKMASDVIVHSKKIYDTTGINEIAQYAPGDEIIYKIQISNVGKGTAYGQNYTDILTNILASESGNGTAKVNPFGNNWIIETTSVGEITLTGATLPRNNENISINNMIIAPNGSITFTIRATIGEKIFGDIQNTSSYGQNTQTALLKPYPGKVQATNIITTLDGKIFSSGMKYKPGDSISYEIKISNIGKGILDNVSISDSILGIVTEESGAATLVSALQNIVVSNPIISGNTTFVESTNGDSQTLIRKNADIGPGQSITINITGEISEKALGVISQNVLTVNNNSILSDIVYPESAVLSGSKTLITPTNNIYKPGDTVSYKLTLTNSGLGYGNDVVLKDLIGEITTEIVGGSEGKAFTNWVISYETPTGSSYTQYTYLNGNINAMNGMNTTIDIGPGVTVTFDITATLAENIVGKVVNIATLGDKNYTSEAITLEPANLSEIQVSKIASSPTYVPDRNIGFQIIIANNSSTTVNDLLLTDIISDIETELAGGLNGSALASGWIITTTIIGDSENSAIKIPSGGNISNAQIDLAKNTQVTINIAGKAASRALGDINNTATWTYNGSPTKTISAKVIPEPGKLSITKSANISSYSPNGTVEYTIAVKNIGLGYVNNGIIEDNLKTIPVTLVDGNEGLAFTSIKLLEQISGGNTKVGTPDLSNGYYQNAADIYPGDTLTIKISAQVNSEAYGPIINNAQAMLENETPTKASVTLTSELGILAFNKTVNKTIYIDGDSLTYTLNLKNTGKGWLKDVKVVDELSKITTTFVDGSTGLAFTSPIDIDDIINIAPNSAQTITATGNLKSGTIGDIKNIALVNGNLSNEVVSTKKIDDLDLNVIGDELYKTGGNENPINTVKYIITLKDTGSTAAELQLTNAILKIQTTSSTGAIINAFSSYKVTEFNFPVGNGINLNVPLNSDISNIDTPIIVTGNLEVGGIITLTVEATLNEQNNQGPIGDIINAVVVEQDGKSNIAEALTQPYLGKPSVTKVIKSLGGKSYVAGMSYVPKDELVYEITLNNFAYGYLKDISLEDNLDLLSTELAGDNTGAAFIDYSWEVISSSSRTILNMNDFKNGSPLNTILTLAPESQVVIRVTGKISEEALGIIPGNIVNFGGIVLRTSPINPGTGKLQLSKEIVSGNPYTPGGTLIYEVKVENIGDGYLNDINLKDMVGNIVTNSVGNNTSNAFASWSVSGRPEPADGIVYVDKSYPNASNLIDVLDIEPGVSAIFTIEGQLSSNIYGDILNTVTATGNGISEKAEVLATAKKAELTLTNTPLNSKYSPGENLGFIITITNGTNAIAAGLSITDLIESMKVETVNGGQEFPFKSDYTITTSISGDISNTSLNIPSTGDLNGIIGDLGPNTTYTITIEGIAIDNAVGDIINSAILNYNSQSIIKEALVSPNTGDIFITKTALQSEFTPNSVLNYQITVENKGTGYAMGVEILDNLTLSGAFEIQSIVASSTANSLSKVYNLKINEGKVNALADIHPGESITLDISGKVLETRIQPISNTAIATYLGENFENTLVLNSTPGILSIGKAQSSNKYTPTGQLYYTLTVINSGNGWLEGVTIYDEVADIQTQILGGGLGPAFQLDTLDSQIINAGISNLTIESPKNLLVKGDIAPNTTVTIVIGGQTSDNAVGIIQNAARVVQNGVTYKSNNVIATQEIAQLLLTKVASSEEYEVGKTIDYTLTLTNNSINNVTGVTLTDLIDKILVQNSNGNMVSSFKPNWNVSYTSDPLTVVSGTVENGKNLEAILDIHSFDSVVFKISAEVIDNAVGPILNRATANEFGVNYIASFESLPKGAEITITKTPQMEKYIPGEPLVYDIKVSNIGLGFADDIVVQDIISSLTVSTPTGVVNAFDMSTAKIAIKDISTGVITTIKDGLSSQDLLDTVDIPPDGFITYEITANVVSDAIGPITNIASAAGVVVENTIISENYKITATMTQEQTTYIPGKEVQFDLIVENIGLGYAYNIDVKEFISNSLTNGIAGNKLKSFNSWKLTKAESQNLSKALGETSNIDVEEVINIPPKGIVKYTVIALVNEELSGDIVVDSTVLDSINSEEFKNSVTFIPPEPLLSLSKTSNKESYNDEDEVVIYTLNIENKGIGNISGIEVSDIISGLKGKNGNPLFTDWTISVKENGEVANDTIAVKNNTDISNILNLRSDAQNSITYIITGNINKGIDDTITNTFIAKNPLTGKIDTASVTNYIKKIPDNEGELKVIKRALKRDIKVGEAVEYEIIVENNNESRFIGVTLKDLIPAGFKYIKGTTELIESGPDGILNTSDDLISISEPVVGNGLNFPVITMEPFTKFRVRYLLKPSIGVTFGKYKNQAYMILNGKKISNTATATVSIIGDSLLDTASIIGKVFYDKNGNGYQDEGEKGIPGVRLITPTGVIAVTDRFGRYHVPDEWVYSKMGENYEVKLDTTTLPKNVEVLTENPQVKRITPQGLTKFNFSIKEIEGEKIEDRNRIYLENGAIWVINDSIEIEPELILTLPERILTKNEELIESLDFTIKTNYGDFISKYEIQIYSQGDNTLASPIGIVSGDKVYNDMKINWSFEQGKNLDFKAGKQLKVRLKVWDKAGNFDITELGYIDLISRKPILDLFDYESKNEVFLQIHNIPLNVGMARFTGDGLKDIEKIYIGDDEYDVDQDSFVISKYMPSEDYNIPIKVINKTGDESKYSLKVTLPETYYISTGIADFSIGRNYVSGNQEVLDVDNPFGPEYFADNIYNEGRIAYYGRGKYKDKLRFVAHIDTKANSMNDMFDNILKRDKQTLFERVEDTDYAYYPTYGDKSYVYKDIETDGKIYLKLQYEKSSIMWGNYNTGFTGTKYMQYNRSLYGAKSNYISNETTVFGDEKYTLTGFLSEPDSLFGHDEFLGTGGSLYFLKNGDILSGTEKVWIKIVNSNTSLTEKVIYLQEGKDYEFDPYQGRIILNKPLNGVASNISGDIIQGSPNGNYYSYLIVDYEYIPTNSQNVDEKDYGLRGKTFINNHVGVGGTYIKENRDGKDYTLTGGEVVLKATENTYFKGEISKSEGVQSDNSFISLDGGLNFKKIGSNSENISGNAYSFAGVLNFSDLNPEIFSPYGNDIRAWYDKKESGYSFASDLGDKELQSYGAEINFRNSDRMKTKIKYESMEKKDYLNSLIDKKESVGIQLEYLITERIAAGLAFEHVEELQENELGKGDLIGARLEYEIDEDTKVYTEGQLTVNKSSNYETNNIITFGGEKALTEKLTLNGKTSFGSRGNYSEVGADYNVTDDYSIYLGYSMDGEEDINKITGGQRARITDKINIYQENQFLKESGRNGTTQSYGIDYEAYEDITFGASFQLGKIELPDNEGKSKRKGISLYSKVEKADFMLKNKIEYREEKENSKIRQYLTTNSFNYVYSDEYTFAGKINFAFTDDIENSKFIESSIGLAYRPVENDKLNFLSRYTMILNDNPNDSDKSKAYVVEFESIYSITERWDLGLKTAYRKEQDTYIRASGNSIIVNNNIYLIGLKANYTILNDWDIYGQYHWLVDEIENDVASGAIIGIYKNIHRNLKFGGGYNFSGFSDNLGIDDYRAHGWFINAIGRF